jgi:hypothetical protein
MEKKLFSITYYPIYVYTVACLIISLIGTSLLFFYLTFEKLKERLLQSEKSTFACMELINTMNEKIILLEKANIKNVEPISIPTFPIINNTSLLDDNILKYISYLLILLILIYCGYGFYSFFAKGILANLIGTIKSKLCLFIVTSFPTVKELVYVDKKTGALFKLIIKDNSNSCDIFVKENGDIIFRTFEDFCIKISKTNPEQSISLINTITDIAPSADFGTMVLKSLGGS